MNDQPPVPDRQRKNDEEHLNLLAIFHFVGAGFALLAILFLLLHFAIFYTVFANPHMWQNSKQTPPPAFFFAIFKWVYLFLGVLFVTSGVLNLISGLSLRARKRRAFSLVVAAMDCMFIPLGTVLGVFTIITLMRESVRELYGE